MIISLVSQQKSKDRPLFPYEEKLLILLSTNQHNMPLTETLK